MLIIPRIGENKLGVIIPKNLRTEYAHEKNSMVASQRFLVFRHPIFFTDPPYYWYKAYVPKHNSFGVF